MSQECPYCQTVVNDDDMEMHGYTCRDTPFMFRETVSSPQVFWGFRILNYWRRKLSVSKTYSKLSRRSLSIGATQSRRNMPSRTLVTILVLRIVSLDRKKVVNDSLLAVPCVECDTFQEHLSGGCVRSLNIIYFKVRSFIDCYYISPIQGEAQITVQRILNLLARYIDLAADHYHRKLDDLRCKALEIDRFMTADIVSDLIILTLITFLWRLSSLRVLVTCIYITDLRSTTCWSPCRSERLSAPERLGCWSWKSRNCGAGWLTGYERSAVSTERSWGNSSALMFDSVLFDEVYPVSHHCMR